MAETLQSVGFALSVLQELRVRETAGVTELAGSVGVGVSTAHRLLATLVEHGFVEQSKGRRYRLGVAMRLSPDQASIEHCIQMSESIVRSLRDESQETVHVSVLSGTRSKFVASAESHHVMRVTSRIGRDIPAHTSAAGKVLLAQLDREELLHLYPDEEIEGVTPRSITSRSALLNELDHVRTLGYGRNFEESEAGLVAIAVPIERPRGRAVCSLTLTGPTVRFNPTGEKGISPKEQQMRTLLLSHAKSLSSRLMY